MSLSLSTQSEPTFLKAGCIKKSTIADRKLLITIAKFTKFTVASEFIITQRTLIYLSHKNMLTNLNSQSTLNQLLTQHFILKEALS